MGIINFKISTDTRLLDKQNHITPYVSNLLTKLHEDLPKRKSSTLNKLLKYTAQFPKVPTFKNYLVAFYSLNYAAKKAEETNLWLLKEHPNYLFGKISQANFFIDAKNYVETKKILGSNLLLNELYPERNEFHLNEVMSYFSVTIRYLFAVNNETEAELRLQILKDIDSEHPKYLEAKRFQSIYFFQLAQKRNEEQQEFKKEVALRDRRSDIQTKETPDFNFLEDIKKLYAHDIHIDENILNDILKLDPNKLEEDLILVLNDTIKRFDYFNDLYETELCDVNIDFPLHAIFLLTYLKSNKALDVLFDVLRQDEDYINFWFGDSLREIMIDALYYIEDNDISKFISFIKETNIHCFNKSIVSEALLSIFQNKAHIIRETGVKYCEDILEFYIENYDNEDIVDTDFLGLFISDLIDYEAEELLDKIKTLFDLQVVGYWICGDYESVKHEISKTQNLQPIAVYETVHDIYEPYKKQWRDDDDDDWGLQNEFHHNYHDNYDESFMPHNNVLEPVKNHIKVGRNEPCPCGSGKKYKKCCL